MLITYKAQKVLRVLAVGGLLYLFLHHPHEVKAAFSFGIEGIEPQVVVSRNQEVTVYLQITNLPTGDNYFRVGFQEGNTYVGYVQDNLGQWVKLRSLDGGCTDYFKISQATSSATLLLKIGDDVNISNGNTIVKAHRYTSTCASNSGSNEVTVTVNISTPTPISTQSPTATATPTSTPISTPAPTPTKTPIPKPTGKLTLTSKPTPEEISEETPAGTPEVLSLTNEQTPLATEAAFQTRQSLPLPALFLIGGGVGFVIIAGVLFMRQKESQYGNLDENENSQ